jgi:hypothetical protein
VAKVLQSGRAGGLHRMRNKFFAAVVALIVHSVGLNSVQAQEAKS